MRSNAPDSVAFLGGIPHEPSISPYIPLCTVSKEARTLGKVGEDLGVIGYESIGDQYVDAGRVRGQAVGVSGFVVKNLQAYWTLFFVQERKRDLQAEKKDG